MTGKKMTDKKKDGVITILFLLSGYEICLSTRQKSGSRQEMAAMAA